MSLRFTLIVSLFALAAASVANTNAVENAGGDRTITKVVKLLQGMLEKSKEEGDEEREIYAKFKCYCDTTDKAKSDNIKMNGEKIELLSSKIDELQGDTGELSADCAKLKSDMADNKAARDEAKAVRGKENKAFEAFEDDAEDAIARMKDAIKTLGAVGADQTSSDGAADNKKFMAGFKGASLVNLKSTVQQALTVASAIMDSNKKAQLTAFIQAPFTGSYTSQSATVIGILKDMQDTFEKNLADAITTEKKAKDAYLEFKKMKEDAWDAMDESYTKKQSELGSNDEALATAKEQKIAAEEEKEDDETFLYDKLQPLCAAKAKSYQQRKILRTNEEAAIAQCISILNSDAAFATFGDTDAGTTGFIQLRAVRRHMAGVKAHSKGANALELLKSAQKKTTSKRLAKIVSMIKAENPFTEVLDEIDKMLEVIKDEGKEDKENLDWCNDERKKAKEFIKEKKSEILGLEQRIDKLDKTINDPEKGLLAQIEETEDALKTNLETQKEETTERTDANLAYQKDVKNLVAAQGILEKGLKVLTKYYDDMEEKVDAGFGNVEGPKGTGSLGGSDRIDGDYEGNSKGGNKAIEMLEFILKSTVSEEMDAHKAEEEAQHKYEDSMQSLKDSQAKDEKLLANLQETLAEKQEALLTANEDLKKTTDLKEDKEAYVEKIKPGCDFITENYDQRKDSRKIESDALKKAISLLKATPVYKEAVLAAKNEGFGDCDSCKSDEDDVKCKAFMADVTIPAYCAGHENTKGC